MESLSDFEIVQQQIAVASKSVFDKYGFAKVSMDDIAKACGKSRTTLYHYFKNKKEVFEYIALHEFQSVLNYASKGTAKNNSLETNLLQFNHRKIKKIKELLKANQSFVLEIRELRDIFQHIFEKTIIIELQCYHQILDWAEENNNMAKLETDRKRFLAIVLITALKNFEEEIIIQNEFESFEKRLDWLIEILCKGLK